jgi:CheY-like chemotaxis protein
VDLLFPHSKAIPAPPMEDPVLKDSAIVDATVLVVDDEEMIRVFVTDCLEMAGYRVLHAASGGEAVALLTADPRTVDLVLLDMTMPGMNGEETYRALRRLRPGLQVLLSSGYSEQAATSRFAGRGLAGFLQKPYRALDLIGRVQKLLDG